MAARRHQPRDVRTRMNAVTGQFETTILDAVERAVMYVHDAIDRRGKELSPADYRRFADRLAALVAGMRPNTD